MSWASRRRTTYLGGTILFFVVIIGFPLAYHFLTVPPTCSDGIQNQGETAPDKGGPCLIVDERTLSPWNIMWARSFKVRDGSYTAVAYIDNPNAAAGVAEAHYHFGLYDSQNVLVAERTGTTPIMPGGITPVLATGIDTGNRDAVHTYFTITDPALMWERMTNPAADIVVGNNRVSNLDTMPRVDAQAQNGSPSSLHDVSFVAVVFDTMGNAFAASGTGIVDMPPTVPQNITFTWPEPFQSQIGRLDIMPILPPVPAPLSAAQ